MTTDQLIAVFWAVTTAFCIVTGCYLIERLLPAERDPGVRVRLENLTIYLFNAVLFTALMPTLNVIALRIPSLHLLQRIESLTWIPDLVKPVLLTLVYALVWDFFQYWVHRAEHRYATLWRFHRAHHEDLSMTSGTTTRQSAGATFIALFCINMPTFSVLGFSGLPYISGIILFSAWGYYNHANVRIVPPAFLDRLISSPNVHRLHHVHALDLQGRNLAAFFTFYDRLFGTYARPEHGLRPSTRAPRVAPSGLQGLMATWLSLGPSVDDQKPRPAANASTTLLPAYEPVTR